MRDQTMWYTKTFFNTKTFIFKKCSYKFVRGVYNFGNIVYECVNKMCLHTYTIRKHCIRFVYTKCGNNFWRAFFGDQNNHFEKTLILFPSS